MTLQKSRNSKMNKMHEVKVAVTNPDGTELVMRHSLLDGKALDALARVAEFFEKRRSESTVFLHTESDGPETIDKRIELINAILS